MVAFTNNVKTAVLLAVLFGLFVLVGSYWGTNGMIVAAIFGVITNFSAWYFSDKIAVAAMRGREVRPDAPGMGGAPAVLYDTVARLARRTNLPMPRVYICPHEAPNAFATGRNPRHAAVAVTAGAIKLLDQDELEGVIAHELAHVKNRDTLTSTVAATIASIFSMLAYMGMFMGGGGSNRGGNPLAMLAMILFGAIGAALIKAMISRSREYVADADGASIAGTPHGLVSALQKLDAYSKRIPLHNPNPAMNNLFIVEPFTGRGITELFATHPPMEKRIAALLRL